MNCTGVATTFVYDGPWGLLLTEAKDVASGSEDDRFTEYKYGDSNEKTQQTNKTIKLYTDGSGGTLEQTAYDYNLQGRMVTVTIDSNGDGVADTQLEYEYNDHGIRTAQTKTTDGNADGDFVDPEDTSERTDYLVDEHNPTGYAQVLEEWVDGTLAKTYTIGHDVFAEAAAASVVRRLLKDGHGSTRMLVDAAGLPLSGQIYRFDAYGNAIGFDPALALTTLLYNAEQFDWRTGLTYLRARYYDAAAGRFNRLDPFFGNLHDPQSLHKYLYTHADGVNNVDPTGLMTLKSLTISMGIGGMLSGMLIGGIRDGVEGAAWGAVFGGVGGVVIALSGVAIGLGLSYTAALLGLTLAPKAAIGGVFATYAFGGSAFSVYEAITANDPRDRAAAIVGLVLSVASPRVIRKLPGYDKMMSHFTGKYSIFKGNVAEWVQIFLLRRAGYEIVARHVRIRTPSTGPKGAEVDVVVRAPNGQLYGFESKFGPYATITTPQNAGYPDIAVGNVDEIISIGHTVSPLTTTDLQGGMPIRVEWWGALWTCIKTVNFP